MRTIVAIYKFICLGIASLITIPSMFIWGVLFNTKPIFYIVPKAYHTVLCKIFRITVEITGTPTTKHAVFLGNHLSYIDIPVMGSILDATFIAKEDVKSWFIFGWLGTLAQTIYISRKRDAAQQCINDIEKMINRGRSLILFPEGTSSRGTKVIPFKSSLFELFLNDSLKNKLFIQPFTITIKKINGEIISNIEDMDKYSWHSDMELMPHLWQMAKLKGAHINIEFHCPRPAKNFKNRKEFAQICYDDVEQALKKNSPLPLDFKQKVP